MDAASLVKGLSPLNALNLRLLVEIRVLCVFKDGEELLSLCDMSVPSKHHSEEIRTVLMIFPELFTMVMVCSRGMMGAADLHFCPRPAETRN